MQKSLVPAIVLGVAALLLLAGVFTKAWFRKSAERGGVSVTVGVSMWGTSAGKACVGGKCESNSQTLTMSSAPDGKAKAWLVFGRVGFIASILTALLLAGIAALFVTKHEQLPLAAFLGMVAVAGSFSCAMMFLVLKPDGMPGLSYSAFLYFAGAIGGVSGANMAKKQAS